MFGSQTKASPHWQMISSDYNYSSMQHPNTAEVTHGYQLDSARFSEEDGSFSKGGQ